MTSKIFLSFSNSLPLNPLRKEFFHSSRSLLFLMKDLPAMKINELKKLSSKHDLPTEGMSKEELIESLVPYADDAPEMEEEGPMDAANEEFWANVIKDAKTLKPLPVESLSLKSLDDAQTEAECFNVLKCIVNDWGMGEKEIMAEAQLLAELDRNEEIEEMDEDEFHDYRVNLHKQMKKKVSSPQWNKSVDEALAEYFAPPYENSDGTADWIKGYCLEFILTTILDNKPVFETTEEWDEMLLLEKVNDLLVPHKLRIAYDPKYNWEDESGKPLTVSLETTDGTFIDSVEKTFEDPTQFDQFELIEPINKLLAPKDLQFVDASYTNDEEEIANYTWVLLSANDAQRLTEKYGPLTNWYERLPQELYDEEGVEEEYEEPEPEKIEKPRKK